MNEDYLHLVASTFRKLGVTCSPGLSDAECSLIERHHRFRFPPDLRALLAFVLPIGDGFPDWRDPEALSVAKSLGWPAAGIAFDVLNGDFWLAEWGARPESTVEQVDRSNAEVARAPRLVPVYAHRYIPAHPCIEGNPVFSVYQTDVIVYGNDLADYLAREFGIPNLFPAPERPREIEFWSCLVL